MGCRFTKKIWDEMDTWAALEGLKPTSWMQAIPIHQWWTARAASTSNYWNGLKTLIIRVCWELCNQTKNAWIFDHEESTSSQVISKIKGVASTWIIAEANHMSIVKPTPLLLSVLFPILHRLVLYLFPSLVLRDPHPELALLCT